MLAFLVVTTIIIIGVGILEPVDLIINGAPPPGGGGGASEAVAGPGSARTKVWGMGAGVTLQFIGDEEAGGKKKPIGCNSKVC